ncbi:hypothetical protein JZO70_10800 [Enterococcus sp. 669A]|uniref:Uncharacterized protein n=1 Tax=Candidatus Enterococcus moelleringii TaxID=2815325 RepID=A0ABS3LAI7_9ENTE|nr:hypothetical protein [Enterococcus sp. 669A]MBO1306653.1 hypothetical protein [Enterococcus sp. 669A]
MKKMIIAIAAVISLGLASQVVEHTINEEAVKTTVQTYLKETPDEDDEENISFEENSFSEWLGF